MSIQFVPTAKCPDGYKLYNNVCYKYFPGPVNWVQASEKCTEQFSSLASIESQAEDFFIRTVVVSVENVHSATYYCKTSLVLFKS